MDRMIGAGAVAAMLGLLAGCGGPPPKPPTVVELTLAADPGVNPTQEGKPAPVLVRVYQLASAAGFEKAEFFPLMNADTATLGQDLVKKDEYLLTPGQKKTETLKPSDRVTAIGVFAAFRQLGSKTWRVTAPVKPNLTTPMTVEVGTAGLAIK